MSWKAPAFASSTWEAFKELQVKAPTSHAEQANETEINYPTPIFLPSRSTSKAQLKAQSQEVSDPEPYIPPVETDIKALAKARALAFAGLDHKPTFTGVRTKPRGTFRKPSDIEIATSVIEEKLKAEKLAKEQRRTTLLRSRQ